MLKLPVLRSISACFWRKNGFFIPGASQRSDCRKIATRVSDTEQRVFVGVASRLDWDDLPLRTSERVTENAGLFDQALAFAFNYQCGCSVVTLVIFAQDA